MKSWRASTAEALPSLINSGKIMKKREMKLLVTLVLQPTHMHTHICMCSAQYLAFFFVHINNLYIPTLLQLVHYSVIINNLLVCVLIRNENIGHIHTLTEY